MYGLTRGMFTLLGAVGVGVLLWLASQLDIGETGEYWGWAGLLAAAGLAAALSQLLGGWTKWGWPRVSGSVFLLGFVPAFVVGGLVLLHAQPDSGAVGSGWAGGLGFGGVADDLAETVLPAVALGLGLVFGFTFDTTGPRVRAVTGAEQVRRPGHDEPLPGDERAADRPVVAESHAPAPTEVTREGEDAKRGSHAAPADADRGPALEASLAPEPGRLRRLFGR